MCFCFCHSLISAKGEDLLLGGGLSGGISGSLGSLLALLGLLLLASLGGLLLLVSLLLVGGGGLGSGRAGVEDEVVVLEDGADETLLLELADGTAGEGSGDAELVAHRGDGDGLLGGDILEELVVGLLVKDDGIVGLFLGLSLGPLLLSRTRNEAESKWRSGAGHTNAQTTQQRARGRERDGGETDLLLGLSSGRGGLGDLLLCLLFLGAALSLLTTARACVSMARAEGWRGAQGAREREGQGGRCD